MKDQSNSEKVRKVYIIPDLTPSEQAKNKALRQQLAGMNKVSNVYMIKNGKIVWMGWEVDSQPPLCTNAAEDVPIMNMCSVDSDSTLFPVYNTNSSIDPGFSMAIVNCPSISSKRLLLLTLFLITHQISLLAVNHGYLDLFLVQKFFQLDIQCIEKIEVMDMEEFL